MRMVSAWLAVGVWLLAFGRLAVGFGVCVGFGFGWLLAGWLLLYGCWRFADWRLALAVGFGCWRGLAIRRSEKSQS